MDSLKLHFAGYDLLNGKVERIAKSTCGRSELQTSNLQLSSPAQSNQFLQLNHLSTVQIVSCPGNIFVVTSLKEVNVTWSEPLFVSSNPIRAPLERVEHNLKSNQVFTWGEYTVLYVAYTNESTSAQCSFKVN